MKLNNKGSLSLIAIGAILAAALIGGTLLYFARTNNANKAPTQTSNTTLDDSAEQSVDELMSQGAQQDSAKQAADESMDYYAGLAYTLTGQLKDVTNSQTIRQTTFEGNSSGIAKSLFAENGFILYANFENLPQPAGDNFYEGWIVDTSRGSVISTGELALKDGEYTNVYVSGADLTDHTFYVLTLEPNDNDPAPADHVIEGRLN